MAAALVARYRVRDLGVFRQVFDGSEATDGRGDFTYYFPAGDTAPNPIWVRAVAVWKPERGRPLDYSEPWDWLSEFCQQHHVAQIAFDVYQLYDFMRRFSAAYGITPARARQQSRM